MEAERRVLAFLNAGAGTASREIDELRRHFGELLDLRSVEPERLHEAVAAAVAAGAAIVAVAGGDGSMHTAAPALVGTETALLCIPTGTLNYFARRHGIPDLAASAEALRSGRTDVVAVGTFQGDYFLNTLTFGEYSRIVRMRERLRSWIGKWPGALAGFLAALITLRRITVTLHVDEHEMRRRTPMVWIGVGVGSFPRVHESVERRSAPDLEVALLRSSTKAATAAFMLRLSWDMMRGRSPVPDPQLEVFHTRDLTLIAGSAYHRTASAQLLDATADGETVRVRGPVRVGVRDAALRLIVPNRVS